MKLLRLSLCTGLLLASAIAARGQGDDPTGLDPVWTTERRSWSGRIPAGDGDDPRRVVVVNEFGDIRVRVSDADIVEASAVVQRRQDVEAEAELFAVEGPGETRLEIRFPHAAIDRELLSPGRRPDRRVDLVVFVPADAGIDVRTVEGLVEAKSLGAPARLRSESGDLTVVTTATVDARTERGAVSVRFRAAQWTESPRIETVTGDIRVELPPGADALGHVSTRFEITTDYTIEIERDGLLKTGLARIGSGGREIYLQSHKGAVKLLAAVE